jgi:putative hydrolase of HD superfamily
MLFEFFYLASELKKIPRKGWQEKIGIIHPESVADHSYITSLLAMVLSDKMTLDTAKVLKMALLHDLAESIIGDFMPSEISKKNKKIIESEAMTEILSKLPENLSKEYESIWQEFLQSKSKESILLHEVDKLEMAIQAAKYSTEGYPIENLRAFIISARKGIKSKELLNILDSISY